MDRRQKKTREAIFRAFSSLLQTQPFESITVQQIINEANIGRSTFYAHFGTKYDLLRALCTDIFAHVFSDALMREKTHDFSRAQPGLEETLTHVLYHLQDNRRDLAGILTSESGTLFLQFFREYLSDLFTRYADCVHIDAPEDFVLHHLVGSFTEAVKWWFSEQMRTPPGELARCFLATLPTA